MGGGGSKNIYECTRGGGQIIDKLVCTCQINDPNNSNNNNSKKIMQQEQ